MKQHVGLAVALLMTTTTAFAADPNPTERPSGAMLSNTCAGCHGTNGASVGAAPPLTGIPVPLFVKAMQQFKSGERGATIMDRIARGYADEDFVAMAEYFAQQ